MAVERYWVGGSGTWDNSATTHWSETSGGANGAAAPASWNDVYFDNNSGVAGAAFTVTVGAVVACTNIHLNGLGNANKTTFAGTNFITCYGDFLMPNPNDITFTFSGNLSFQRNGGTQVIDTGGKALPCLIDFGSVGATLQLGSDLQITKPSAIQLNFLGGAFDANSKKVTLYNQSNGVGGASGKTFTGSNSFYDLTVDSGIYNYPTFAIAVNIQVTHTAVLKGNNATAQRLVLSATNPDVSLTITGTTGNNFANLNIRNLIIIADTNPLDLSGITGGCSTNGERGFTATTPRTLYFYPTASYQVSNPLNWWTVPGGNGTQQTLIPFGQDDIYFDSSVAYQTITLDNIFLGKNVDFSSATGATFSCSLTSTFYIFGNLTIDTGQQTTFSGGSILFEPLNDITIINRATNGFGTKAVVIRTASGKTTTLGSDINSNAGCIITGHPISTSGGTFDANNHNLSMGYFTFGSSSIIGGAPITVKMGSGTWQTTTGASNTDAWNNTTGTIECGTSTIKITNPGNYTAKFMGRSQKYHILWFARGSNTNPLNITGNNTFYEIKDTGSAGHSYAFETNSIQHTTLFTVNGSPGNIVTIAWLNAGPAYLVKDGGGTITCDYLELQGNIATPRNSWYCTNSNNYQYFTTPNGSGWTFGSPPSPPTAKGANALMGLF